MRIIASMIIAFSTYSRIPMPAVEWSDANRKYAMCFFPLIGAVIGALLWGWLWLCDVLAAGAFLRGAGAALLPLLVTGGIHMDGFMDTCDAMASWQTKDRRLEILKDSHVGAFAVMGCAGYLLLDAAVWSEASLQDAPMLGCIFVLSRALSAWAMTALKSARPSGMLGAFAQASHRRMVSISSVLYGIGCAVCWFALSGWSGAAYLVAAGLCLLCYKRMAYKHFGGVTGDLAGWFVQIAELVLAMIILSGGKLQ